MSPAFLLPVYHDAFDILPTPHSLKANMSFTIHLIKTVRSYKKLFSDLYDRIRCNLNFNLNYTQNVVKLCLPPQV